MVAHIRSFKLAAVLAAVTLFSSVGVASAAAPCGSHDAVAKSLTTKFKEARRIMGVVNAKAVMEIFMSPQGTWTVLVTDTTDTACVIATGQDWQEVPIEVTGLDSWKSKGNSPSLLDFWNTLFKRSGAARVTISQSLVAD